MPRFLFSINDDPAPSGQFAVELPDNAAALREAAELQEELAGLDPNRLVGVNIWTEHGHRLGRVETQPNLTRPRRTRDQRPE